MKIKSLLSFFVPAALMALSVASCSDYDNGYNESAIKFAESFRDTFGEIDPEQDWNLAERATVTVSTQKESNIKIYALVGDEYSIVGNYEDVKGTHILGIDVIEGTRNLLVTDGRTAQQCAPGDVVTFSTEMSTRTVYDTSNASATVQVTKLTGAVNTLGDGKTYNQYRTSNQAEVQGMLNTIPQGVNNLSKPTVHHDFTYVSTGSFIIYPFYWYTASHNTIGLYYYDANNNEVRVPIITPNDVNGTTELWYQEGNSLDSNSDYGLNGNNYTVNPGSWTRSGENSSVGSFQAQNSTTSSDYGDGSGVNAEDGKPFLEVWTNPGNHLGTQSFSKIFTNFTPNAEYRVKVKARLADQGKSSVDNMSKYETVRFTANNQTVTMTHDATAVRTMYNSWPLIYPNMSGTNTMWVICKANASGQINVSFNLQGVQANWFSFKDLTFEKLSDTTHDVEARGHEYFSTSGGVKGQGIRVDIPADTKFGMYLEKTDATGFYRIYSEGKLNEGNPGLVGENKEYPSCYASTFYVGDQMFIGFEDWPGAHNGDYDLNDMVFTFDGYKPTIINEDPTPSAWMLACEDLGGTFDRDYNDVIFKVQHVSGETKAYVTPVAAGGTLASYIFYVPQQGNEQCLGEIHQLFGFAPAESGKYEAHNVIGPSRGSEGTTVEITVPEDWSMTYYSTNTYSRPQVSGGTDEGYQNMGGFEIRTLPKGTEAISSNYENWYNITALSSGASRIPAPDMGAAPYIICFPYSFMEMNTPSVGRKTETFWAWPQEFVYIDNCYPDFSKWVSNHRTYGEWYKNKTAGSMTVDDLKYVSSMYASVQQASPLTVQNGNTTVNTSVDLKSLVSTSSTGNITYGVFDSNGNQVASATKAYNESFTYTPTAAGTYTIVVIQAADADYYASDSKTCLLTVTEAAKPNGLAYTIVVEPQSETSRLNDNYSVSAFPGDYIWIHSKHPDNGSEYHREGLTASYNGQTISIGNNKYGWSNAIGFNLTGFGTQTITLHAPADNNYCEQTITITVYVAQKVMLKSMDNNHTNYYGLALKDNKLVTADYNQGDETQFWYKVVPKDGAGKLQPNNGFCLYNIKAQRYLYFNTPTDLQLKENQPWGSGQARFDIDGEGKIYENYYHPYYSEKGWGALYIGLTSFTTSGGGFPTGYVTEANNWCKFEFEYINW